MEPIWINAGEYSGDMQAGALLRALRERRPELSAIGMGGPNLAGAGQRNLFNIDALSVMGLAEVVSALPRALRILRHIRREMTRCRPRAVVLVDAPEFNFRVAKIAAELGIPVYYFIPPKVWAWRTGRVAFLRRYIKKLLCILPFEEAFYRQHGLDVAYVGNPLVDMVDWASLQNISPIVGRIGLMPGSRQKEVSTLMPLFGATAATLRAQHPGVSFHCLRAPNMSTQTLQNAWGVDVPLQMEEPEGRYAFMRSCECLVAASGTATLETALAGVPTIITYKVSPLSWFVGKRVVRVPWVGLPNLIMGREIFPELLQHHATPDKLVEYLSSWLHDPVALATVRNDTAEVRQRCGNAGSAGRAADVLLTAMAKDGVY